MSEPYETVRYESRDRVIRITLNRPDKRNAISKKMLLELLDAFERADTEPDACVIVLSGAGDASFSSGADLETMGGTESFLSTHEDRGLFPHLFLKILHHSKPTIAAVNGHCLAGAVGLMLSCDLAIAKSGFKIGTPEIKRGLFPYMISALILRTIGRRAACEMMLLGESVTTDDACRIGLVNLTVPADVFDDTVMSWAKKLSTYSPAVLRLGRRALVQQEDMSLEGAFAHLQGLITVNSMLRDAAEGITAFFEKREPVFKGE